MMPSNIESILSEIHTLELELAALDSKIDSCSSESELNQIGTDCAEIDRQLKIFGDVAHKYDLLKGIPDEVSERVASAKRRL